MHTCKKQLLQLGKHTLSNQQQQYAAVSAYRAFCGPGLVTVAHVAGGAEGKVDVVTAGANPVVLTPPACGQVMLIPHKKANPLRGSFGENV
jgi:hypothetical protein